MPTGIDSTMLDELGGLGRVFPVFELTVDGTTHRFAEEPIASESQGRYEPFVVNWGPINRDAGNSRDYSLQTPRFCVNVSDENRVIQKAVAVSEMIGNAAKQLIRSYHVTQANHYTLVDGIIKDYRLVGNRIYQFVLGPDDRALLALNNEIPTISGAIWFRAPSSSIGQDGQIVYGEHKSSGTDATGMVSTFQVHEYWNWWYLSIGTVEAVTNVWRNGTIATSDFSLVTQEYNGVTYSLLQDDSDTSVSADTITADVDGIEDASGTVETDPVNVLSHFFTNYTSVTTNSTHMAEAQSFLSDRNQKCSKVIRSSDSPLTVFNGWCKTFKMVPFWAWDWDLAVRPYNNAPSTIYLDSRHVHQVAQKILSDIACSTDYSAVISRISLNRILQDAASSYAFSNFIEDSDRDLISTTDSFEFGEARVA